LAVYLPGLDRPLRDAEAKYAQVPREMLETGDWLTPRLDGARYYVKPPLGYWPTAALFAVVGPSEAAARLTNVASALVAALLIGLLARRLFGPTPGLLSGALFLLTTEVYVYCLDAGLEFWLIACQVLAFLFLWRGSLFGFHAALGLGFLVKGLPGVVIPLAAAALADPRRAMRLLHPSGLAGLALIVGPWLAWMTLQHPDFFDVFVVNEHLRRFAGRMISNDALFPTWLWLVLVTAEFFPWILHLPGAGRELARMVRANAVAREKAVFLGAWAAVPLVLYALSRSTCWANAASRPGGAGPFRGWESRASRRPACWCCCWPTTPTGSSPWKFRRCRRPRSSCPRRACSGWAPAWPSSASARGWPWAPWPCSARCSSRCSV
jgi:4-amino-4-deoxy-L-arabinose transferase-like glycosyltransferase